MTTIFTKIINGEVPSYKVAETADFFAFLDINPNSAGHTLCVPKTPVDKVLDMREEDFLSLMRFSRKVGIAIEKAISCKRVGMSIIGLEVPHTHVHLIPLHTMVDATFQQKTTLTADQFKDIAAKISANM